VSLAEHDPPVGAIEIASLLGVRRATVDQWRQRRLLPEPEWTVGGRPAWRESSILAWARSTGRLTALETAVRRILCELERPNVAFTGEMNAAIVEASDCVHHSPYAALSLLNSELEHEQRRLRGMAAGATVEYAARMLREVVIAMSGHHARSD
jgi:predicted DNA-binding transcriptional regulator AlpA